MPNSIVPKPTVFISHSSRDEQILRLIKQKLNDKLGGTVDIFLSSDGQSIPLGRNWVHRIEKALSGAKLMVIFLSPASIKSNWVYFEAGYSYSKGIRVVPVAILGVDLAHIGAPLSLLQGFNINNSDGLNNIIALVNETFDFAHKETFTEGEYNEIFRLSDLRKSSTLMSLASNISIRYKGLKSGNASEMLSSFGQDIITPRPNPRMFYAHGFDVRLEDEGLLVVRIDPSLSNTIFPMIDKALSKFTTNETKLEIKIVFNSLVDCISDSSQLTARFYDSEISLCEGFLYKGMRFSLHTEYFRLGSGGFKTGTAYLQIETTARNLSDVPFGQFISLLIERGAIYFKENYTQ